MIIGHELASFSFGFNIEKNLITKINPKKARVKVQVRASSQKAKKQQPEMNVLIIRYVKI